MQRFNGHRVRKGFELSRIDDLDNDNPHEDMENEIEEVKDVVGNMSQTGDQVS